MDDTDRYLAVKVPMVSCPRCGVSGALGKTASSEATAGQHPGRRRYQLATSRMYVLRSVGTTASVSWNISHPSQSKETDTGEAWLPSKARPDYKLFYINALQRIFQIWQSPLVQKFLPGEVIDPPSTAVLTGVKRPECVCQADGI